MAKTLGIPRPSIFRRSARRLKKFADAHMERLDRRIDIHDCELDCPIPHPERRFDGRDGPRHARWQHALSNRDLGKATFDVDHHAD